MRFRATWAAAVLAAAALAPAVRAEEKSQKPALILRIKSIDGLIADVKYLAKLAGQEETLNQVEPVAQAFLGGIDTKRPIAMYGDVTAGLQDSPVVILIPISDEKAFLELLNDKAQIKPEKDKDGVYTIDNIPNLPAPVTLYFRFAHKYAYITAMEKGNIELKKLLKPEEVVFPAGDTSALSLDLRLASLPDIVKQIVLAQLENKLAEAKEQKVENETPAAKQVREKSIDSFGARVKMILTDGEALSLKTGVNSKTDDITFDLSFKAKSGTPLAKEIASAGKSEAMFAGVGGKNAAIKFSIAAMLPEEMRANLGQIVDQGIKEALEKEKDPAKAKVAKQLLEAIAPTLKAGDLDLGLAVTGPDADSKYTGVFGLKIKDGEKLEKTLRSVIADMPAKDREKVQLDAATVGDMKLHKMLFDDKDEDAKRVFGASGVYVGFKDDAMFVALGPDAMKALKEAVALKPAHGPMVNLNVLASRVAGMNPDKKAAAAAKDVFSKAAPGSDTISVTVDNSYGIKLKVLVKGKLIELGTKVQKE